MARLGEYDTRIDDGQHLDVYIEQVEMHEGFSIEWSVNDIGIVHLEQNVHFNGKFLLLKEIANQFILI